jgi:hypothetical protein
VGSRPLFVRPNLEAPYYNFVTPETQGHQQLPKNRYSGLAQKHDSLSLLPGEAVV